jgi:hypothetical protein
MFALSSLGFGLPWFGSLLDPQAAAVRDLHQREKQHRERAEQAEQRGQHDQAMQERNQERECHNRAVQIVRTLLLVYRVSLTINDLNDLRHESLTLTNALNVLFLVLYL